jgi:MEMO1 family protein
MDKTMMGNTVQHGAPLYVRRAHHAGSWYSDDANQLREQLKNFLDQAEAKKKQSTLTLPDTTGLQRSPLRGIIAPHAGYSYSGRTAAYSFLPLLHELQSPMSPIRRILVLHPSHHVYLPGRCAVSNASVLETPLGSLEVDTNLRMELLAIDGIETMDRHEDENEHSGEMQFPYLALCLKERGRDTVASNITVTPVMVGSLTTEEETRFGKALSDIIMRQDVFTVVSSDFCHWGQRFRFQPMPSSEESSLAIHRFIEALDRRGMDLIAAQEPGAFAEYLKETKNTICGRHPIAVWLRSLEHAKPSNLSILFQSYDQSSAVRRSHESSVSYAAAVAIQGSPE